MSKTRAIFFPFDLFGSSGTAAGAELLSDAVAEMLADNRRERQPTRARAYTSKVRRQEMSFVRWEDYQDWQPRARQEIRQTIDRGDFLLWVTGNHLGVLPLYEELTQDPTDTLIVQFDAHLDIYNLAGCTSELSHGNFLLHCAQPMPGIINVGHRELLLRPEYIARFFRQTFAAAELAVAVEPCLEYLRRAAGQAKRVFLDLDCDVFDPAYFPALLHPLPLGLSPALFLRILDAVWSERVMGLALSEFAPARDQADRSLATLLWLLEHLLLRRHEK